MRTYLLTLLLSLLGTLYFLACSTDPETTPTRNSFKSDILAQINDIRRSGCQCGSTYMPPVPSLDWNELLEAAAKRHVADMEQHQHFDHRGTDGSSPAERIQDTGYLWSTQGENIAYGVKKPKAVLDLWKKSEDHCKNMMSPEFTEVGVAEFNGYWVQTLARPR